MRTPSRIGLFGGAFDPVHHGHIAVASLARECLELSLVLFAPGGLPPHKQCTVHASAAHRLAMLELAIGHTEGFTIYRGEIDRPGPSYTVDTVRELRGTYPGAELVLIVGSDNLPEIPTWHRYRELLKMVRLCVVHRPGHSLKRPDALRDADVMGIDSPEWGLSSSQVRTLVWQGRSCNGLIPPAVRRYIDEHRLYVDRQDRRSRPRYAHDT